MNRWLAMVALVLVASGCKGETKYRDSPETLKALEICRNNMKELEQRKAELDERVRKLETGALDGDVVVRIEGDAFEITGKGPSGRAGTGTAAVDDKALYEAFLSNVNGSRGAIKKCYQQALKNNASLQARTVTLNVNVRFSTAGKAAGSSFAPQISSSFDECMRAVTAKWSVPAPPRSVAFQAPVTLTPQ